MIPPRVEISIAGGVVGMVLAYLLVVFLFFSFLFVIMRLLFLGTKSLMQPYLWREQNL